MIGKYKNVLTSLKVEKIKINNIWYLQRFDFSSIVTEP